MSRITQVAPESAQGKTRDLFGGIQTKLGRVPNMMRALGNSSAALEAYLQFSGGLSRGGLSAKHREQIALAVGQAKGCEYCLAAHTALGRMSGLTVEQIRDSRLAASVDSQTDGLLRFARKVVDHRGRVTDEDLQELQQLGFTEGEIVEVVANVALNLFTNYFNHVAATDVDFPAAEPLPASEVACSTESCGCAR